MKREYDFSKMKELKNRYAGKKQAVGINLNSEVVDYFKGMADETGRPYQKLIDFSSRLREKAQETDDEVGSAGVSILSPSPDGSTSHVNCPRNYLRIFLTSGLSHRVSLANWYGGKFRVNVTTSP